MKFVLWVLDEDFEDEIFFPAFQLVFVFLKEHAPLGPSLQGQIQVFPQETNAMEEVETVGEVAAAFLFRQLETLQKRDFLGLVGTTGNEVVEVFEVVEDVIQEHRRVVLVVLVDEKEIEANAVLDFFWKLFEGLVEVVYVLEEPGKLLVVVFLEELALELIQQLLVLLVHQG